MTKPLDETYASLLRKEMPEVEGLEWRPARPSGYPGGWVWTFSEDDTQINCTPVTDEHARALINDAAWRWFLTLGDGKKVAMEQIHNVTEDIHCPWITAGTEDHFFIADEGEDIAEAVDAATEGA